MDISSEQVRQAGAAVGTWFWERIGKELLSRLSTKAKNQWATRSWRESAENYKARLLNIHSTTKLLGNPKEIDLGRMFTDVYVLDQISAFRRLEIEDLNRRATDGFGLEAYVVRRPLLSVSEQSNRLYILGKPGSGKSTFLKAIARLCCLGEIDKIPVFVSLRDWMESGEPLEQFIQKEFAVCEFPDAGSFIQNILASGEAIVLFDGLDEVPNKDRSRRKTIKSLTLFCRQYPKAKIIVTCRTAATDYSFEKFDYVEIADFNCEQQVDFLQKWYSDSPDLGKQILNEWKDDKNRALVELAKTPLLLALLCLAFDETRLIPRRRIELYEEAINALLRRWDSSREIDRDELYRSLSHIRKEQLFSKIARSAFEEGSIFVRKKAAIKYITDFVSELPPEDTSESFDGIAILKAIEAQHGIFVERAYDIYAFSHLTIHEYFVAKSISESVKGDALKRFVAEHATDDQWREVLLMLASMLDDGSLLVDAMVDAMGEIARKCPEIRVFWTKSLDVAKKSRMGAIEVRRKTVEDRFSILLWETMLSTMANLKVMHIKNLDITLPRILMQKLGDNKDILIATFMNKPEAQKLATKYFRLAYLITECLHLAKLPGREKYVKSIFDSLRSSD